MVLIWISLMTSDLGLPPTLLCWWAKPLVGWDYYSGTADINSVCLDLCWLLQTPPTFSVTVKFPGVEPHRFPCNPPGTRSKYRLPQSNPQCSMGGVVPWVLFSHWRNHRLRGDLSIWYCPGLGEKQCGQCVAASLTLVMQSVLVCSAGECFNLTPVF